jgi:type IV pilus assembly protein PilM
MKFNFLSKSLPAFGLDVSSGSLKIMELAKKGKSVFVKGFSNAPLPKAAIINDEIADPKTFAFVLKQALQKPQFGRIDTNYVVASLPESKSFVRVIQIPHMSDSEAESAVPYEAESFIPLPIDQVYLDWQKIGGGTEDKMNILMIASPKDFVDKYLDVLDSVNLKPVALEVESQSCHRAVIADKSDETVLLVDMESYRSSLIMVEEGNLQFTSTIPIAGNTFTDGIAKSLGVSSAKAEEIKRRIGIANTVEYPNAKLSLLPVLNNLSAEIKNILKFHNEHSRNQVKKILLIGGSSKLKNLPEYLFAQLQDAGITAAELANPWQNLATLKNPPLDSFEALNFVTAIGLASRGVEHEVD